MRILFNFISIESLHACTHSGNCSVPLAKGTISYLYRTGLYLYHDRYVSAILCVLWLIEMKHAELILLSH
jgi:hypothetical protein